MKIEGGELLIEGVVQLLDSTGGGLPVVLHLHKIGSGDEDFAWRPEQEGRYVFRDVDIAWRVAPKLLENEVARRQADGLPHDKLRVVALVLDGTGPVKRTAAASPISTNSPMQAGAGRGSSGVIQSRPSPARTAKRKASASKPAPANVVRPGADRWRAAYENMERRGLA